MRQSKQAFYPNGPAMEDDIQQLFELFVEDSRETLTALEKDLVALEGGHGSEEMLAAVRRDIHTLKGSCAMFGLAVARSIAHRLEDLVAAAIASGSWSTQMADLFLEGSDLLKGLIEAHAAGAGDPGPDDPPYADFLQRVRIADEEASADAEEIEALASRLLNALDEVLPEVEDFTDVGTVRDAAAALARRIGTHDEEIPSAPAADSPPPVLAGDAPPENGQADDADAAPHQRSLRVPERTIDTFLDHVGELVSASEMCKHVERRVARGELTDSLRREFRVIAGNLDEHVFMLQDSLMELRRAAVRNILTPLPRLARDLAHDLSKDVEVEISGDGAMIDKSLLEPVEACLVQMLRNAVAHGIEPPAGRRAAGKPERGRITVAARNKNRDLILEIEDDGQGVDLRRVRQRAVEMGQLGGEAAAQLDEDAAAMLIFSSGLSTAAEIGMHSGRGVGLDVVASEIRNLGGNFSVRNRPGHGLAITLRIPMDVTLSVITGIVSQTGNTRFVVPNASVEENVYPRAEALSTVRGGKGEALLLRGELLPLHRTGRLFNIPEARADATRGVAVVLGARARRAAFLFDALHDIQQVVVKPIAGLSLMPGIQGGAILGDGTVGLVLDPEALLRASEG
jgi:two-component system, chemotaxis family, sensor kinase CheA